MKISSQVKNGKLHPAVRETLTRELAKMEGKYVEVEIKPRRRSLAQNKYRWGVVVKTVMDALNRELENLGLPQCDLEDADLFLKDKAFGLVKKVDTEFGELILQGRLKNRTTQEFEDYMTQARVWGAETGIYIPEPNEEERLEWYRENFEK